MNNFNNSIESYKINEAKKRMGTLNNNLNMYTNLTNNTTNNLTNSTSTSNVPNLNNSAFVNANEIQSTKSKMNNYSSTNTTQKGMY